MIWRRFLLVLASEPSARFRLSPTVSVTDSVSEALRETADMARGQIAYMTSRTVVRWRLACLFVVSTIAQPIGAFQTGHSLPEGYRFSMLKWPRVLSLDAAGGQE